MQAKEDSYYHARWKEREARVRDRMNQLHAAKSSAFTTCLFNKVFRGGMLYFILSTLKEV